MVLSRAPIDQGNMVKMEIFRFHQRDIREFLILYLEFHQLSNAPIQSVHRAREHVQNLDSLISQGLHGHSAGGNTRRSTMAVRMGVSENFSSDFGDVRLLAGRSR